MQIVINPSPARDYDKRRWNKFAELADRLHVKYVATITFLGAPEQYRYISSIMYEMEYRIFAENYSRGNDIPYVIKTLQDSDLLITVNTMPMHLGVVLKVPTVAIIGGTPASIVAPKDNPNFRYVENVDRINDISVDEVMDQVEELMNGKALDSHRADEPA